MVGPQRPERLLGARPLGAQRLLGGVLARCQDALVLGTQCLRGLLALALGGRFGVLAGRGSLCQRVIARHERHGQLLSEARKLALAGLVGLRGRGGVQGLGLAVGGCWRVCRGVVIRRHDDRAHRAALTRRRLLHERQGVQQLRDLAARGHRGAHCKLRHHSDVAQSEGVTGVGHSEHECTVVGKAHGRGQVARCGRLSQ